MKLLLFALPHPVHIAYNVAELAYKLATIENTSDAYEALGTAIFCTIFPKTSAVYALLVLGTEAYAIYAAFCDRKIKYLMEDILDKEKEWKLPNEQLLVTKGPKSQNTSHPIGRSTLNELTP
jgi:hypothetical protein